MKKIRVLHVVLCYYVGGLEEVVKQILINSDKDEFENELFIVHNLFEQKLVKMLFKYNIKIHTTSVNYYKHHNIFYLFNFKMKDEIENIIKNGNYDVIHAHHDAIFYIAKFASYYRIPVRIYTAHSNCINMIKTSAYVKKYNFNTVAISQYIQNYLSKMIKNVKLIENGIDLEHYKSENRVINKNETKLVCVARLSKEKNHLLLLKAFRLIPKSKNIRLYIVGNGNMIKKIEKYIARHFLKDRVILCGKRLDVKDILASSDIFILLSKEPFGLAYIEAMVAGLPILALNQGAAPEIIKDGINGYLLNNNPKEIARIIVQLSESDELKKNMGINSMKISERYSSKIMTKNYERLYKELIMKDGERA